MKKYYLLAIMAILSFAVNAQTTTWTSDPQHSRLGFVLKHLAVSEIEGRFSDFSAVVTTTKADYSDAKVVLTAKVTSIDTDNDARDNHLRTADFFDVEKFPTLTFTSTSLKKVNAKKAILYGKLTFHGITKPIALNVTFFGKVTNPMNNKLTAGFQVSGIVKRSNYALGTKYPNMVISDEVKLAANVEFSPDK
jgi:polyisoprenoid-binding protein YceI